MVCGSGVGMPLVIIIKVVPGSGQNKWVFDKAGQLKCYLKNPPEKGLANKELIKLIAKGLGITQEEVTIVAGATSRTKMVRIAKDLTLELFLQGLAIEKQQSMFEK
jgi:uncharacterized protein (TIGR00251 family)